MTAFCRFASSLNEQNEAAGIIAGHGTTGVGAMRRAKEVPVSKGLSSGIRGEGKAEFIFSAAWETSGCETPVADPERGELVGPDNLPQPGARDEYPTDRGRREGIRWCNCRSRLLVWLRWRS